MSLRDTIVRNTFWYGLVTVAGLAAGLVMSIVLARGLGPHAMGDYSYLLWIARVVTAVATLGFAVATTRYTAEALGRGDRGGAAAFVHFFARRQLLATAVVAAALLPLAAWLAPGNLRWPLVIVALGLFPTTLEAIYTHAVHGAQRYDLTTQVSTFKMVLFLLSAVAVVGLGGGILALVAGTTIATTISCGLQRRQVRQLYTARPDAIAPPARAEMRAFLLPLSVVAVLDTIVWDRSELLFLRLYTSSEEIAFYSVAFGLATRAMVAPHVVAGTLLPALATLHGREARGDFQQLYREALRAVALVGVPLTAVVAALAPGVVHVLYGAPYAAVAPLLGPLLAVSLVGVMRQVAWAALRATGDRHWGLHITWASAAVNLALAALLIPAHGTWGAVAANAAAQLMASGLAFFAVARRPGCGFPLVDVLRAALAGVAGALAARGIGTAIPGLAGLLAGGAGGVIAFAAAAQALGVVGARDWRVLTRAVPAIPARLWTGAATLAAVGLVALLYAPVVGRLAAVWLHGHYYSHGFLVPLFSAYLVWDARDRLRTAEAAPSPAGGALVLLGLLLLGTGLGHESLTLQALSAPVVLGGLAVLAVGFRAAAPLGFPLAFLAFMAPLPEPALLALSLPLQYLAAAVATAVLGAVGVPSTRDGLLIHLPQTTLLVGEACNGLRFLFAMIVVGTAFAWRAECRPPRRLLIMALAVTLALLGNLVRVTGTGWLAHHYGAEAASGFFHAAYGKAVYAVMLVPLVLGVLLLRRPPGMRASHGR
jgi:exosortase